MRKDTSPVSPDDFDAFYARYRGFVFHALKQAGYPGDTEDGLQDTFIKFWRYKDRYLAGGSAGDGGWLPLLGTIATRLAIDENRRMRERTRTQYDPILHDRTDDDPRGNPERLLLSRERGGLLNDLLDGLTPVQRVAVLTFNSGRTAADLPDVGRLRHRLKTAAWRGRCAMRRHILRNPEKYGPLLAGGREGGA